jgi:hypothetical protein
MSSRPRPILKPSSSPGPLLPASHPSRGSHVHFPAQLSRTYSAHSRNEYDRSAIVVAPNTCALPARGCPGRTYVPSQEYDYDPTDDHASRAALRAAGSPPRFSHSPSKPKYAEPHPHFLAHPPPFMDNSSSESDESSDCVSTGHPVHSIPVLHYGAPVPIPQSKNMPYNPPPIHNHAQYGAGSPPLYPPAPVQDPSFLPYAPEQPKKKKHSSSAAVRKSPQRPSFSPWSSEEGCLGGF